MSWPHKVLGTIRRVVGIESRLKAMFADRDLAVELLTLATVCQEHLLLIGPPGTAKTDLINHFTELIDAKPFHYLLTRFTEPSELFGPLDLKAFQEGTYHICTSNMLPDAQIAFLDEVFQGSSAILNSLLTLVNERVFFNGSVRQRVPLICLIGASNSLPDDPGLQAFADRFPLRLQVDPVNEDHLAALIDQGWELERARIELGPADLTRPGPRVLPEVKLNDLIDLSRRLLEVETGRIRPAYADLVRQLRAEGIELSDRRIVKGLKLVAGAALLRESSEADARDLWPLNHFWNRPEEVEVVRGVVQPRVEEAGGRALEPGREPAEIVADLEVLDGHAPSVRTQAALGAHLSALNRLRREVLKDHPGDAALRVRVEESIRNGLSRLEGAYV